MPRPRKWRKVCSMPDRSCFVPHGSEFDENACVLMSVDEYEAIRLIDYQGFKQEDAAEYMKVARSTIQQIYTDARKKIATSIVEARPLKIEGGDYQLCSGEEEYCSCGGCQRHRSCPKKNTK